MYVRAELAVAPRRHETLWQPPQQYLRLRHNRSCSRPGNRLNSYGRMNWGFAVMCRRLAAAMAFLTLLFALGVVAACGDVAAAGSDPQIVVTGNPHISADMIRSHF